MNTSQKEAIRLISSQEEDGGKNEEITFSDAKKKIEQHYKNEKGSKLLQFIAAATANLSIVSTGSVLGWTSSALIELEKNPVSPYNPIGLVITKQESSWIGSLLTIGAICGSMVAGWMGEKFGRKRSLLFSAIPCIIGWILIGTSKSVIQFYIARFTFGIGVAISFTIVPMYCGEIAETSIRGVLGSFVQLFLSIGLLYSYSIGPFVSYTLFWLLCGALPVIFFISFIFLPESPYYLLKKGMKTAAQKSLSKLRGKSMIAVLPELNEIQAAIDQAYSTEVKISDLVTNKANFKALLFTCTAVSFQQLTGIAAFQFYAQSIFKSSGTTLDPAVCTIIIGIVPFCASGLTPIIADKFNRRTLLIISGIGTTTFTGTLGAYFYLKEVKKSSYISELGWLPITSLILFMCLYCLGWGPLPWAIMGEIFSSEVKAKASGITVLIGWIWTFVISKYFSNVVALMGTYTAFWMFSVFCILSIIFVVILLPETKGKSLQQIQNELNGIDLLKQNEEMQKLKNYSST